MQPMDSQKTINAIRVFLSTQPFDNYTIALFGSRARGDNSPDSDYDIALIFNADLTSNEKRKLKRELLKSLIENNLMLPMDLIIKTTQEFQEEAQFIGNVCYEIQNEGIVL